jgi:hypothetical protein
MPRVGIEKRRALAERLRKIAAEAKPAIEWKEIAAEYRRHADELDPPPGPKSHKAAVTAKSAKR